MGWRGLEKWPQHLTEDRARTGVMMKSNNENFNISNQALNGILLLILVMLVIVAGCTNSASTKHAFEEVMSHTRNNASPNWRNIEPGKTTEAEFGKIVSISPDNFDNLSQGELLGSELQPKGTQYI